MALYGVQGCEEVAELVVATDVDIVAEAQIVDDDMTVQEGVAMPDDEQDVT